MLPYHDENETLRPAYVTIALIVVNVLVWILIQGAGIPEAVAASVCNYGLVPGELTMAAIPGDRFPMGENLVCVVDPGREVSHLLTSMFLHGSWMHLLGNMWFLWLFGNNIEDSMTHGRFVAFYVLSGIAAALFQVFADPDSIVPMVGASGAISGVMGAYLVLYPRARVYTLVPLGFFITTIALPAWAMLLYWAFIQLVSGVSDVVAGQEGAGGVAFWAHLGGFIAGIVLVKIFERPDRVAEHESHQWRPRRAGW
jgi:membrane associated rhomboid family serine protease